MDITERIQQIDQAFNEAVAEYNGYMNELDKFRGISLSELDTQRVNEILYHIQECYSYKIYPLVHYVNGRKVQLETIDKYYKGFMEDLKAAGAVTQQKEGNA